MKKYIAVTFFVFSSLVINSQVVSTDTVVVKPGAEYTAGAMYRLLFGDHWRNLWTEPIKVPVIDLRNFAGGLKPYEVGGGQQTRSLKFYGNDGQRWKFRSINKDPSKLLPEEFHETFVEEVLQDQISSANPFSAIISADLLKTVGILQAVPQIVVLPDDPVLGKFRAEFAGMLGTIEVHPDEADSVDDIEFFNTEKIKGTFKLFGTIEKKRNDKVYAEEFLKVRLMDVLMGDWDRHADQWRWAKVEENYWDYWIPIPRDRDQAFAKFDGLFPSMAEYLIPQLTSFNYAYPQIEDLTWNGRHIDRRFLTELSKEKWDSITTYIQNTLTDEAIVSAVKRLPDSQYKIAGDELISKLKERRDNLDDVVDEYYELLNGVADIYGTHKDDYILVQRIDDYFTSVTIFELDKSEQAPEGRAYFYKIFRNDITSEIRIHMLDDDDYCLVTGRVDDSPMIRVIGGKGKDIFADNSIVNGYLFSFLPISSTENKTIFYDSGNKTSYVSGSGTSFDDDEWEEPDDIIEKYEPQQRDRGVNWVGLPDAGYNSMNGVELGATLSLYSYDFRKVPYKSLQEISFMYAFLPKSYNIEYFGEFIDVIGSTDFVVEAKKNELDVINYFGFGNENGYDRSLYRDRFYGMQQEIVLFNPRLRFPLSDISFLDFGFFYEYAETKLNNNNLLNGFRYDDYGLGVFHSIGTNLAFQIDTRDNEFLPMSGNYLKISGKVYNEIFENKERYTRARFDLRNYNTIEFPMSTTLALKASGGKIWGKYPFYNAIFLGGEDNLRGVTEGRYSGDAAVTLQAELRTKILDSFWFLRGDIGLHGLVEIGRSFTSNQNSEMWHKSYGGGIWASYLKRELVFAFTVAKSLDEINFYLDTRMAF